MKATNPKKVWQAPTGPCQHCGQVEHERSCVAELKGQLADRDKRIDELSAALGKALGEVAHVHHVVSERDKQIAELIAEATKPAGLEVMQQQVGEGA